MLGELIIYPCEYRLNFIVPTFVYPFAVHLIYLHRSLFTILLDDDVLVVHSDCGVVSLYRGWCTVAVGFSKGEGWHHGSHHHYVFDIHNTIFYVVSYSY